MIEIDVAYFLYKLQYLYKRAYKNEEKNCRRIS